MNGRGELLVWVEKQHKGQLIRKTELPYIHHLKTVAETADLAPLGYEIGLCHDLLEDTSVTIEKLFQALLKFRYSEAHAMIIVNGVIELTNVFTKKAYPKWRKSFRKKKEAQRLATISPVAQTVKYADLMYNINWMSTYDLKHLKKYLVKKESLLKTMTKGDQSLHLKIMQYVGLATTL